VQLLAPADAKLQLHPAVLQVDLQRDERIPLPGYLPLQLADLAFMQQQALGPERVGVEDAALFIWADVHPFHQNLAAMDAGVTLLQVHPALTDGLDLRALELHPAFVALFHEVVMAGAAVLGNGLNALHFRHLRPPSGRNIISYTIPVYNESPGSPPPVRRRIGSFSSIRTAWPSLRRYSQASFTGRPVMSRSARIYHRIWSR